VRDDVRKWRKIGTEDERATLLPALERTRRRKRKMKVSSMKDTRSDMLVGITLEQSHMPLLDFLNTYYTPNTATSKDTETKITNKDFWLQFTCHLHVSQVKEI
jgi:hypothetical protein